MSNSPRGRKELDTTERLTTAKYVEPYLKMLAGSYGYSEPASRFRLPVCTVATFSYPDCVSEDDYLIYIIIF